MIPLTLTSPLKPCYLPYIVPLRLHTRYNQLKKLNQKKKLRDGKCRAEFSGDAPVALAIGACILNSLIFPATLPPEDSEAESLIDSDDARFVVMGIISFIPYFNWMSWVFAWLDTGKRRYAAYAIVYLAPYLRPNLSISPEESWLPIASILISIAHIQLEASIKNGDIQGFQVEKLVSSISKHSGNSKEMERRNDEIRDLAVAQDREDHDISNENEDSDGDEEIIFSVNNFAMCFWDGRILPYRGAFNHQS
ncbi:Unknown protein [Striga hermonthica]|uniref:Uncharacterized protein n=1 Tax=Striga hermonthica TaxID=68872 RepID=A0A9N7RDQ1_STRHE|nr:Unknown protein [Striga hermonthica]